jgi:glutathione S-transferase
MTIKLHHLNDSRSMRILWLLEEAQIPYQLIRYQRDATTMQAPDSLKVIHPLGKSPVIEDNGKKIVESGAIVEYLINRYARHLAPAQESDDYVEYLQWIHFAESSAMLPILIKLFNQFESQSGTKLNFLDNYAAQEFDKVFSYLDNCLAERTFMVGDNFSGADLMLGYVVDLLLSRFHLAERYPHIQRYDQQLKQRPSWQKVVEIEAAANH